MPEKNMKISIEEQKNFKPSIEEVICNFLKGDALENAMNFIAFLMENGMNPRWASANQWRVTGRKTKEICNIQLGGAKGAHMRYLQPGDWVIGGLEGLDRKHLDDFISCDEMKQFIWAHIKPCTRCCSCGPRLNRTYAGLFTDECCGLRIINPDPKELEYAKKIITANKRYISENA